MRFLHISLFAIAAFAAQIPGFEVEGQSSKVLTIDEALKKYPNMDVVNSHSSFSDLRALLRDPSLELTFFAPTDNAMNAFLHRHTFTDEIARHHLVTKSLHPNDLQDLQFVQTEMHPFHDDLASQVPCIL